MTNAQSPVLCFFTHDDYINELCLAYWSLNEQGKWCSSFTQLMLQTRKSRPALCSLIKEKTSAYIPYLRCEECTQPIQVISRTHFESVRRTAKRNKKYCCDSCISKLAATRSKPPELSPDQVSEPTSHQVRSAIDYSQLDYTNAVLLYSLLSAAGEQWNKNTIAPINAQIGTLAPTPNLTTEIYLHLHSEKIIIPSPSVCSRPFHNIGDNSYFAFLPNEITWILALDERKMTQTSLMNALELIIGKFDPGAASALWYLIAEAECERYFGELCDRYRFKRQMLYTEKVAGAIRYCLDRISLPQVWNILWCTMRTVAALVQEGTYSHPHVYNMISTIVMRDVDRRIANNQQIRPWSRLQPHKESAITSVLFDKVFNTGTAAFEQVNGKNSSFYRQPYNAIPRSANSNVEPKR